MSAQTELRVLLHVEAVAQAADERKAAGRARGMVASPSSHPPVVLLDNRAVGLGLRAPPPWLK